MAACTNTQVNNRLARLTSPFAPRAARGSVTICDQNLHRELSEDVKLEKNEYNKSDLGPGHAVNADIQCSLIRQKNTQMFGTRRRTKLEPVHCSMSSRSSNISTVSTCETIASSRQLDPKSCRKLLRKSDPEFRSMKETYDDLLEAEINNSMDVEHFLLEDELLKLRKREMLYRKWSDNVYEPIMWSVYRVVYPQLCSPDIQNCVENLVAHPGESQRLHCYNDYLSYVNKRGFAFLDTCQATDYCPLTISPPAVTAKLNDPLSLQERQRLTERAQVISCTVGSRVNASDVPDISLPALSTGRPLDTWKSLSNVHLHDIESPCRSASRLRMSPSRNSSSVDLSFSPALPGDCQPMEKPRTCA